MIVQLIKVNLKFTYIQHCCEPLFIDLLVFTQLFPRFVIKLVHLEVLPSTYKHFLVLVERGRVHLCGSNVVLNLLIPTKKRKHHHILGSNHCLLQSAYGTIPCLFTAKTGWYFNITKRCSRDYKTRYTCNMFYKHKCPREQSFKILHL